MFCVNIFVTLGTKRIIGDGSSINFSMILDILIALYSFNFLLVFAKVKMMGHLLQLYGIHVL
jgi:hypothetical protein